MGGGGASDAAKQRFRTLPGTARADGRGLPSALVLALADLRPPLLRFQPRSPQPHRLLTMKRLVRVSKRKYRHVWRYLVRFWYGQWAREQDNGGVWPLPRCFGTSYWEPALGIRFTQHRLNARERTILLYR